MDTYDHGTKRSSSSLELSAPTEKNSSKQTHDAMVNWDCSRQNSIPNLPRLHKAQTWHAVGTSANISEASPRNRKPSFRLAFPTQQPAMLIPNLPHALPGGLLTLESLPCSLLPTVLSQFHLTPPAEESSASPLEQHLSQYPVSRSHPFFSDTASMSSSKSETASSVLEGDGLQAEKINESSDLDLSSIVAFIVNALAKLQTSPTAISMVHQPLPFPLPQRMPNNNLFTPTLFSELLSVLRSDDRLTTSGIRIIHALVDQVLAENLPTSPPVTPSYLSQNSNKQAQGYFTLKPIYTSIAGSKGLVLPPGEALISIAERIIPPSAEFEVSSFLNEAIDSGFCERLSELKPGGLFTLVLPTESGGLTFHQKYLSPLLDPILRNISTRLGLRSQLSIDISNAVALKQLTSLAAMRARIEGLLTEAKNLNCPDTTVPEFKLIWSSKGTVQLSFEAWYCWWFGQEKERILGLLNYHLNVLGQGIAGSNVSRSSIMSEIQGEMQKTGTARGKVDAGIELGVFIIQRIS